MYKGVFEKEEARQMVSTSPGEKKTNEEKILPLTV